MKPKKPKRCKCHVCGRTRLAKYIEWHPGIREWQCKDFDDCDKAEARRDKHEQKQQD